MAYLLSPCDLGSQEFMSSHVPPVPGAQHLIFSATALAKGKRSKRYRLHNWSSEPEPELPIPRSQKVWWHAAFSSDLSEEEEVEQQQVAARCLLMMSTCRSASASPTTSESRADLVASPVPEPPRRRIKKPRKFIYLDDAENHTAAAQQQQPRPETDPSASTSANPAERAFCHFRLWAPTEPPARTRAAINEAAGSGSAFLSVEEMKKAKTHECPVCHRIFPSGQALGGHRRTHSTSAATATATTTAKTTARTSLSGTEQPPSSSSRPSATKMMELDLNILASAEDDSGVSDYLDAQIADRRSFRPWWADEETMTTPTANWRATGDSAGEQEQPLI